MEERSPIFCSGKNPKLYNGAYGQFLLCFPNSQKPANGDRGNYREYMSHNGFSLTHVLVLGGPSPIFTGAKNSIFGNIFDNIRNCRPTTPKLGEIWKI